MTALRVELEAALRAAHAAGDVLRGFFRRGVAVDRKAGDEPVTEADRQAQAAILAILEAEFPGDGILAEERADTTSWATHERAWLIDPLDGTKDFIADRPGFSSMVGLLVGGLPVLGVVHQPIHDLTYHATRGAGAFVIEGRRAPVLLRTTSTSDPAQARLVASASHRSPMINDVKRELGIQTEHNVGSVGLKVSLVARGERDLYVNPESFCRLWDVAAPQVILEEAGGRITDLFGNAIRYVPTELRLGRGLIASNGACHDAVVAKIAPLFAGRSR